MCDGTSAVDKVELKCMANQTPYRRSGDSFPQEVTEASVFSIPSSFLAAQYVFVLNAQTVGSILSAVLKIPLISFYPTL